MDFNIFRENVKQLFECFCEIAAPVGEKPAWILQKYPNTFLDVEILKSVPKFTYPCEFEKYINFGNIIKLYDFMCLFYYHCFCVFSVLVQHFSFVLTSIDSKWTFGFCRHDPKRETALVILSALPWHETFYKFVWWFIEFSWVCFKNQNIRNALCITGY